MRARFRGWHVGSTTTTSHLPRKRARMLILGASPLRVSMRTRFQGWHVGSTTTTSHLPRKRACMLVLKAPPLRASMCAHFRRWYVAFTTTTSHLPWKRAYTLVFEGGGCLSAPPPTTLENEHARSFSRVACCIHHHQCTTSHKWVRMLVLEGSGCLLPPPPPTTLENGHVYIINYEQFNVVL